MKKTITLIAEKGHALTDGKGDYCKAITYPADSEIEYYEVEMTDEEYSAKRAEIAEREDSQNES